MTRPLGAGAARAGSSIAGYGVAPVAVAPNLVPLPDVSTGQSRGGRYINPATQSYQFTADGRLLGMANVPQLVYLRAKTARGSAVLPTLGQTYSNTQEQRGDFQRRCATEVNAMLADVIKAGLVKLLAVSVQTAPGVSDGAVILFRWRDLTTGIETTTKYGP